MTTIYLTKATRSQVAQELQSIASVMKFTIKQATGKRNFLSEGFTLSKLDRVVEVKYAKDGYNLYQLPMLLTEAFAEEVIPEKIAYKEALALLQQDSLKEASRKHYTSNALRKQDDFELVKLAEYLLGFHSEDFTDGGLVLKCYLSSCLMVKFRGSKRNKFHKESFRKQVIRLIQSMQQSEFVEELKREFPEVFEEEVALA